jgi:serine-aspartate repeat-containing protein C/D/E
VASGWISGGDGFLAIDSNGNGRIDGISELFGGNGKGDGFAKLASFDSNADGLVNDLDAAFGQLMVWRDANGNHATDAGELVGLADAGVASLTTAYTELPQLDAQGNLHLERSTATLSDGMSIAMTDVYFNVSADDAAAAGVSLPTMADLLGNDGALDTLLGATPQGLGGLAADAADCAVDCANDSAEALRRLAALTRDHAHGAVAA